MIYPSQAQTLSGLVAARYWTVLLRIKIWLLGGRCGKRLRCSGPVSLRIHRNGSLVIGSNVTINASFLANPVGSGCGASIWVGPGAVLLIGDDVGMSHMEIVCTHSIEIGQGTKIGGGVRIYDSDFHSLDYRRRQQVPDTGVVRKPINIGKNVFIGAYAMILKGVQIGDASVVGASSLVSRDVPAAEIWAGNPCVHLKKLDM